MTDEIRITRWHQMNEKDSVKFEFVDNQISREYVEERVKWYDSLFDKPSPEISTKTSQAKKGLSVVMVQDGDENFSLQGMNVDRIGNRTSGERDDGSTWERQGVTVSDVTGNLSVVAWGDQTDLLKGLMKNDTVDVLKIRELKMYKGKKQAHLGSDSEVVKQ